MSNTFNNFTHKLYIILILQSFENLWLQFNKLNENVTENYSTACATLNHVNEVCDSTTNDILSNYHKAVERNETLQQKIQDDIDILKSDVESNMAKVTFNFPLISKLLSTLKNNINKIY